MVYNCALDVVFKGEVAGTADVLKCKYCGET